MDALVFVHFSGSCLSGLEWLSINVTMLNVSPLQLNTGFNFSDLHVMQKTKDNYLDLVNPPVVNSTFVFHIMHLVLR